MSIEAGLLGMDTELIKMLLHDETFNSTAILLALLSIITLALSYMASHMVKLFKTVIEAKAIFMEAKAMLSPKDKDYTPQIMLEKLIGERLQTIKSEVFADRVMIFQYHNGEKSVANVPFLKLTCTHETISALATSIQLDVAALTANLFGYWNQMLFSNQSISIPDFHDSATNESSENVLKGDVRGLYQFLTARGTKSIYLFPLLDTHGKTFAIGVVDYTHRTHELNEEWHNWLLSQFSNVGSIIASLGVSKSKGVCDDSKTN